MTEMRYGPLNVQYVLFFESDESKLFLRICMALYFIDEDGAGLHRIEQRIRIRMVERRVEL